MSRLETKGQAVNLLDLAALYNVHRNTASTWVKRGMPYVQKADRSKGIEWVFDTAEVAQWREELAVKDAVGDTEQATKEELERRRLAAETSLAEMKAAEMRGELIYIDDAVKIMTDDSLACKAVLRNIPQRVSALIVGETDERRIKEIIGHEIDIALDELANQFIKEPENSGEEAERGESSVVGSTAGTEAIRVG